MIGQWTLSCERKKTLGWKKNNHQKKKISQWPSSTFINSKLEVRICDDRYHFLKIKNLLLTWLFIHILCFQSSPRYCENS
jgi:hypothetical protein